MRAYLTGTTSTSIWVYYERWKGEFCGHPLPAGLRKHQRLDKPILTPSTKANDGAHDVSASREEILRQTAMAKEDFDRSAEIAHALFARGQSICAERGLILVDTKYEFGKTSEGEVVVIDEVHTPDSSRFWFSNTYDDRFRAGADAESFDKEYVRPYLVVQGFRGESSIPTMSVWKLCAATLQQSKQSAESPSHRWWGNPPRCGLREISASVDAPNGAIARFRLPGLRSTLSDTQVDCLDNSKTQGTGPAAARSPVPRAGRSDAAWQCVARGAVVVGNLVDALAGVSNRAPPIAHDESRRQKRRWPSHPFTFWPGRCPGDRLATWWFSETMPK